MSNMSKRAAQFAQPDDGTDWLEAALAMPFERSRVEVAGAGVELLCRGERGAPGILFAHGMAANADWWRAIAGPLSQHFRVAALSFSGMGQSDWRDSYDLDLFATELDEAARAGGLEEADTPPLLVGHSFGGFPAIVSAARSPERWRGLVLVDSRANDSLAQLPRPAERSQPRVFHDREELVARFRLMPEQRCRTPRLLDEVAQYSVRQWGGEIGGDPEGWTWASDPDVLPDFSGHVITELVAGLSCPLAYVHGEDSYIVRTGMLEGIRANFPPETPVVAIPDAGHHLILDQPVAVIAVLRLLDTVLGSC